MTRSAFRIVGPAGTALFAVLLLVAFAVSHTPGPNGALAGGSLACSSPVDSQYGEGYSYDDWGNPGEVIGFQLYSVDPDTTGDQPVEIIFGGATPEAGELAGVGYIPINDYSNYDLEWTVPNLPPGTYNMWVCWYNNETATYYYEAVNPFLILGAPECGTYDGGPTFVTPGDVSAFPAEPYPGEEISMDVSQPPPGTSQNVNPDSIEFLLDPDLPGDLGTHIGQGFSYYFDNGGGDYFSEVYGYGANLPGDIPTGPHTLALCWYNNPTETWYYSTVQVNVVPEGTPRLDCLDVSFYYEDDTASANIIPTSGYPGDAFDIGWTSFAVPYAAEGDEDWGVDVVWDWVANPGDTRPGDPQADQLVGEGVYHTYAQNPQGEGEASGFVPLDAAPGDHVISLCVQTYWNDGGFAWIDIPFTVLGTTPTPSPTPTPTPSPTPTPTPTPTPPPTPTPTPTPVEPTTPPTPSPTVAGITATPQPTEPPTTAPTLTPTPHFTLPPSTPTPSPTDFVGTPAPPAQTPTPTLLPPETLTPVPSTPAPTPVVTPTPTAPPTTAPTATSAPTPTPTATPTAAPTGTQQPTATPGPIVQPTATSISASATPNPTIVGGIEATPTPTPEPTFSPSPSPTALAEQDEPGDGDDNPGSDIPGNRTFNDNRPDVARSLFTPTHISGNFGVIGTNVVLAGMTLVLMLVTAEIFNQTLEENEDDIKSFFGKLIGPVKGAFEPLTYFGRVVTDGKGVAGLFAPIVLLALAALLYGLEEPGWGINGQTVVLFFSFLAAFAVLTYLYDGGQLLITNSYGVPGAIRLFPAGIAVALFCIAMTRLMGFTPGLIYGFLAAHTLLGGAALTDEQEGKQIFFPAVALLTVCVAAWLLVNPARDLANDHTSIWSAIPEGVAVGIFVGGLESMFFQMVPIKWMDGWRLFKWNKLIWFGMTAVSAFLFWHVLLNAERQSFDTLSQTTPAIAMLFMGLCFFLTLGTYLFFRIKNAREPVGA